MELYQDGRARPSRLFSKVAAAIMVFSPQQHLAAEPEMVVIPEGEFWMGSDAGAKNEKPARRVWVDRFALARHAVTNRLYRQFVEMTGRAAPPVWGDERFNHPDQPVTSVSWFDAVAYCAWLVMVTGKAYRLPTEAEWERAARGGLEGKLYTWGDSAPQAEPRYHELWLAGPEPVGQRAANGFGLYDISENVHEWCADWYDESYYERAPARNPRGPEAGTRRSSRGGSWRHQIKITRVAARSSIPPEYRYSDYGFRCAMSL
jgi:iron(II)-dependent oxidoreductase